MIINVNRIDEKGYSISDSLPMDENLLLEEDSHFLENVDFEILLTRNKNQIKAIGKIKTALSLRCVRCVEYFNLKINSDFDIILFPIDLIEKKSTGLDPDEMEYIFFEGDRIDVIKILMDQINLFIPYSPICSTTCKGICPNCGANLNQEKCQCDESIREINFIFEKPKR